MSIGAQLGIVDESVYGTPVTVTRFYDFTSESFKLTIDRLESSAFRANSRVIRSDRWAAGKRSVDGSFEVELANKSQGLLFKHMFGDVTTSQPDAAGSPTVYKHVFSPGDLPTAFTAQVGRTDSAGVLRPFTYHGCRVADWKLSVETGSLGMLEVSVIGEDEDTSIPLATASYPTGLSVFSSIQTSMTVAGSAADVTGFDLSGNNGLADDRYYLGSALRKLPIEAGLREYTGSLQCTFDNYTAYNLFVNGTEAQVVALVQGGTISGTYKYEAKLTFNVRFDGETPNVGGREMTAQPLPFKVIQSGATTDTAIKLEYQTTDVAP